MAHLYQHGLATVHVQDYQRRREMRSSKATPPIIDPSPTPLSREHYTDDFCGRSAEAFLKRWAVGEPWLLWVNFPGPHEPFDPPAELLKRYERVEFPPPVDPDPRQVHDYQALRRCYAGMIEGIDEWIGRLITAVKQRGELENTVIVFASDHGEMLGDHGCWYKSVAYEGSIHVPLVIAGPGIRNNSVSDSLVELIDVSATMLDFAGLSLPDDCDARTLRPVLTGERNSHRDVQLCELGCWRAIIDGQYKLIEDDEADARLFDLKSDPAERGNLLPDRPGIAAALSARLGRERALDKCINPERPESSGVQQWARQDSNL